MDGNTLIVCEIERVNGSRLNTEGQVEASVFASHSEASRVIDGEDEPSACRFGVTRIRRVFWASMTGSTLHWLSIKKSSQIVQSKKRDRRSKMACSEFLHIFPILSHPTASFTSPSKPIITCLSLLSL